MFAVPVKVEKFEKIQVYFLDKMIMLQLIPWQIGSWL
jgi:hypothetical protein